MFYLISTPPRLPLLPTPLFSLSIALVDDQAKRIVRAVAAVCTAAYQQHKQKAQSPMSPSVDRQPSVRAPQPQAPAQAQAQAQAPVM